METGDDARNANAAGREVHLAPAPHAAPRAASPPRGNSPEPCEREQCTLVLEIADNLRKCRHMAVGFVACLGLVFGAGLVFRQHILRPILQWIYPPQQIYGDMKAEFLKDRQLKRALADSEVKQAIFRDLARTIHQGVKLDNFPEIRDELPPEIWHTMRSGDKETYLKLLDESGLADALKAKYYRDLLITYETHKPYHQEALVESIKEKGTVELQAKVEMVASKFDGKHTACGRRFCHRELHAIVVIPSAAADNTYSWLRCPRSSYPVLFLEVQVNGSTMSYVEVVGVERTGKLDTLVIRVSRAVAEKLGFPSENSSMHGRFKTIDARFQ